MQERALKMGATVSIPDLHTIARRSMPLYLWVLYSDILGSSALDAPYMVTELTGHFLRLQCIR